jgi:hypothetical protein
MKKRLSLSRIFKQRDKLFQTIRPYIELKLVAGTFQDFVADVYRVLPTHASRDAVFESCRHLAGDVLVKKTAAEFAWRLAGNVDLLISGVPVIRWTRQIADEWLPVQVVRIDPATRRTKSGYVFQCRALAGSYCPDVFEQFLSRGSCAAISRIIGFSRSRPYTNALYFTHLRFWAFIEASRSVDGLHFQQVDCAPAMLARNRRIISLRTRSAPCPRAFEHPCELCVLGADSCQASIFQKQLELLQCGSCNTESYFDLTRSADMCLACWQSRQAKQIAGN